VYFTVYENQFRTYFWFMEPVLKYFQAERAWCWFGLATTILATLVAVYFLVKVKQPFYNGMGYSLILLSIGLGSICISVITRSPKDISRVTNMIQSKSKEIATTEIPRMTAVQRNFNVFITAEAVLIVVCCAALYFLSAGSPWRGVAAGVLMYAVYLMAFDTIARARGKVYLDFLSTLGQ
jgi:hypothetical protein